MLLANGFSARARISHSILPRARARCTRPMKWKRWFSKRNGRHREIQNHVQETNTLHMHTYILYHRQWERQVIDMNYGPGVHNEWSLNSWLVLNPRCNHRPKYIVIGKYIVLAKSLCNLMNLQIGQRAKISFVYEKSSSKNIVKARLDCIIAYHVYCRC